jgi:hypothetical protein
MVVCGYLQSCADDRWRRGGSRARNFHRQARSYNLMNPSTNYQSGVDFHLDWRASRYLTDDLFVGPVGYFYNELGCDSGSGDSCFQSRVAGLGAQVGYSFPVEKMQGYVNLKVTATLAPRTAQAGGACGLRFQSRCPNRRLHPPGRRCCINDVGPRARA